MKRAGFAYFVAPALLATLTFVDLPQATAHHTGASHVHFQKPQIGRQGSPRASSDRLQFRPTSDSVETVREAQQAPATQQRAVASSKQPESIPVQVSEPVQVSDSAADARRPAFVRAAEAQRKPAQQKKAAPQREKQQVAQTPSSDAGAANLRENLATGRPRLASSATPVVRGKVVFPSQMRGQVEPAAYCDTCVGDCTCEPGCGLVDPGCGMVDPGCGCAEPGCGICEPACGIGYEPGCGICEPACGCIEPNCGCEPGCGMVDGCGMGVGCGTCVARPGPDYDCIPICIPRFKDMQIWGGVHGFKGPRDAPAFGGPGDGNFGFQEGIQISGRAPFIGLMFPQLSYQLGYQAVQSRLSGDSSPSGEDRSQQFVTGGFFRRANVGVQYGVVFDLLRDDYQMEEDFHQIRYEISLKSKKGREIGFMGATHTNDVFVAGVTYQTVEQYVGFYRWHFRNGGTGRFWGGASNDDEGIFGGDFEVPLNDRWSLQSGFNYLITDRDAGADGAQEEAWNVGMNLIWHWGRTARSGRCNPYRGLFRVADNGLLMVDEAP